LTKNGITYHYHVNGHGDVTALTDANGNIVAEYEYDAWGNILFQTGSMASQNPIRYAGYYFDEETDLYYLMARYYDANIGRFLTRDSFHGFEDDPQSLNLYSYTKNNPVIYVDHDGHNPLLIAAARMIIRYAAPQLKKWGLKAATKIATYAKRVLNKFTKEFDIRVNPHSDQIVLVLKKQRKKGEDARIFSLDYHHLPAIKNKKGLPQPGRIFHYHIAPNPKIHYVFGWSVKRGYYVPKHPLYRLV
jgi:RHS repeat-associated protein